MELKVEVKTTGDSSKQARGTWPVRCAKHSAAGQLALIALPLHNVVLRSSHQVEHEGVRAHSLLTRRRNS